MDDVKEYLKNELGNYYVLKKWIQRDCDHYRSAVKRLEEKIMEIDIRLSQGNLKGASLSVYQADAPSGDPFLPLLIKQDEYIRQRDEMIGQSQKDAHGYRERLEVIDDCLKALNPEDRSLVLDAYARHVSLPDCAAKYHRSLRQIYRDLDRCLDEMAKRKKI